MDAIQTLIGIGTGAVAGVVWSVGGYIYKKTGKDGDEVSFQKKGLAKAVFTGIIVGGYAGFYGITDLSTINMATATLVGNVTLTAVVEKGFKIVWNLGLKLKKRLNF